MKQALQSRQGAAITKLASKYPYHTAWLGFSSVLALGIALNTAFVGGVITFAICGMVSTAVGALIKYID